MDPKWSPKWTRNGARKVTTFRHRFGPILDTILEPNLDPGWTDCLTPFRCPASGHFPAQKGIHSGLHFRPGKLPLSSTRKWSHASAGLLPVWRQESSHFPAQESRHLPMRFWCPVWRQESYHFPRPLCCPCWGPLPLQESGLLLGPFSLSASDNFPAPASDNFLARESGYTVFPSGHFIGILG